MLVRVEEMDSQSEVCCIWTNDVYGFHILRHLFLKPRTSLQLHYLLRCHRCQLRSLLHVRNTGR